MAVLYIKNGEGMFVPVPALPGPKGDPGTPGRAAARNYLDNSNFMHVVNQRALAHGAGASAHFIDRWLLDTGVSFSLLPAGGLRLVNTGEQESGIEQYLDEKTSPAAGQMLTLALADMEGGVFCGSAQMPGSGETELFASADGSVRGLLAAPQGSKPARVRLTLSAGASAVLRWAALYDGEYPLGVLPDYVPRSYAQELSECQRYLLRFDRGLIAPGVSKADKLFEFSIPLALPLRAGARLAFHSQASAVCAGASYPVSFVYSMASSEYREPALLVGMRCEGDQTVPENHAAACLLPELEISAEP